MCKYCEKLEYNGNFYLNTGEQRLCYEDDDWHCCVDVHISFCPFCGRSLDPKKSKDLYFVGCYPDSSVCDMEMLEDETEAKRAAELDLSAGESNYLFTYRLIRKQRVFLPEGYIFEDIE